MAKQKFIISMVLQDDMLERFKEDMKDNDGWIPKTISRILEDRYGIKDGIKRGYTHIKDSKGIPIKITKGDQVKIFKTMVDTCDYLICSREKLYNRVNKEHMKEERIDGWKVELLD